MNKHPLLAALSMAAAAAIISPAAGASGDTMAFRLATNGETCDQCTWIVADGRITESTPDDFVSFLKASDVPPGTWLQLNSPGGDLMAGIALGAEIRQHSLKTSVAATDRHSGRETVGPGYCASACSYAYLGGVYRTMHNGSQLGMHQYRLSEESASSVDLNTALQDSQYTMATLYDYVETMGASPQLVTIGSNVPSDDIYWLTREEMQSFGVTNDLQKNLTAWQLETMQSGLWATTSLDISRPDGKPVIVSAFCSATDPSQSVFYLYAPTSIQKSQEAEFLDAISGISVKTGLLRLQGDRDSIDQRMVNGSLAVMIPIETGFLDDLAKVPTFEIGIDISPDYVGYLQPAAIATYTIATDGLSKILPVILKNCVE